MSKMLGLLSGSQKSEARDKSGSPKESVTSWEQDIPPPHRDTVFLNKADMSLPGIF